MRRELRIGGLHRGGGNFDVGPFHYEPPSGKMSVVELDSTGNDKYGPRGRPVIQVSAISKRSGRRRLGLYMTLHNDEMVYFPDEVTLRAWMEAHNFRKWHKKHRRSTSVLGVWVGK